MAGGLNSTVELSFIFIHKLLESSRLSPAGGGDVVLVAGETSYHEGWVKVGNLRVEYPPSDIRGRW